MNSRDIVFFICFILAACGSSPENSDAGNDKPFSHYTYSALPAEAQDVIRKIENALASDACDSNHPERCQFKEVRFEGDASPPTTDEDVIMIVDQGMVLPTLALHSSRVIAHFRAVSGPKYYEPFKPSVQMPAGMSYILHDALKGNEALASSKPLFFLGKTFQRKYSKVVVNPKQMGHGTTTFNLLAELNPRAKFVVVHTDEKELPLCQWNQPGAEAELRRAWKEEAEALTKIATAYRVKWVNYSMGSDLPSMQRRWTERKCAGPVPTQEKMRELVNESNAIPRALSTIPGLLFVQAAPYSENYLDEQTAKDYCADCEVLPRRLRVGYYHSKLDFLPNESSRNLSLLPNMMRNVAPCTDIFIRDGFLDLSTPGPAPIYHSVFGFGHAVLNTSGTSFIAPAGLSYAAYLMKAKGLSPEELVKFVRGTKDTPLLAAPFHRRQFLYDNPLYVNAPDDAPGGE